LINSCSTKNPAYKPQRELANIKWEKLRYTSEFPMESIDPETGEKYVFVKVAMKATKNIPGNTELLYFYDFEACGHPVFGTSILQSDKGPTSNDEPEG
jgi:hypothetical protein